MTRTYPDQTLEKALRERGWTVRCNWQMPGPKNTQIAWMEHLTVTDGKGGIGCVIVQTFKGTGWDVYVEPTNTNDIGETVDAVVRILAGTNEWTDQCHAADRAKERSE
jgi:hypothetical protein